MLDKVHTSAFPYLPCISGNAFFTERIQDINNWCKKEMITIKWPSFYRQGVFLWKARFYLLTYIMKRKTRKCDWMRNEDGRGQNENKKQADYGICGLSLESFNLHNFLNLKCSNLTATGNCIYFWVNWTAWVDEKLLKQFRISSGVDKQNSNQ